MKVKEVHWRNCCDWNADDLVPIIGTEFLNGMPIEVLCVHCGAVHKLIRTTDAAGSGEWDYRKETEAHG